MVPPVIRPPMFGSTPGSELSSRTGSRPRETSRVNRRGVEHRGSNRCRRLHADRVGSDSQCLADPRPQRDNARVVRFIRLQLDVDSFNGAEPGHAHADFVGPDDQCRDVENAAGVRHGGSPALRLRVGDLDQRPRNREALLVMDDPGDRAGGNRLLSRRDAAIGEQHRQRRRQRPCDACPAARAASSLRTFCCTHGLPSCSCANEDTCLMSNPFVSFMAYLLFGPVSPPGTRTQALRRSGCRIRRDRMSRQFLVHAAEDGLRVGGAAEFDGAQRAARRTCARRPVSARARRAGRR